MVSGVPTDKEDFNVWHKCLLRTGVSSECRPNLLWKSGWHSVVTSYCFVFLTLNLFGARRPSFLILGPSLNTVFGNQIKDDAFAPLRCYRCFGAVYRSHLQGSTLIHGDGRELCTPRPRWENNVKIFKNMFCCVVTLCNLIGPNVCRSKQTLSSGCKR